MTINIENGNLRVLITGGAGFIGGCLIRRLLNSTNATIFNLDKISYASDLTGINKSNNINKHFLLKVDLINLKDTKSAVLEANPDLIFHLAAESHVDRSIENSYPFIQSNIIGTYNILESAREYWENLNTSRKEKFRFLHVSTDEVFGSLGSKGRFKETTAYDPRSPYSASKAASDHLSNAWLHTYRLPIIRTNCSNNFGPFQFPEKLIPLVIQKALRNSKIPIYGNGENIRDWLYVEDHIDALILAITKGKLGSTYCIGGNNEKTNLEVVYKICELLDELHHKENSFKNLIEFVSDRPGHDKRYAIDSSLISNELGWEAKHNFDNALSKTIDWYIKNQYWCENIQKNAGYKGDRIGLNWKSKNSSKS